MQEEEFRLQAAQAHSTQAPEHGWSFAVNPADTQDWDICQLFSVLPAQAHFGAPYSSWQFVRGRFKPLPEQPAQEFPGDCMQSNAEPQTLSALANLQPDQVD